MTNTPEHAEREHSEISASSCKRWWNCPGSVAASRGVPRQDSAYSLEGTAAHELAELCLRDGPDAATFVDRAIAGHLVDDEMAEAVQVYVDFVRGMKGEVSLEKRVRLDALDPPAPMFGMCDAFSYCPSEKRLHIADLKYGSGVWVPAEGNPQLLYYALGATLALGNDQPVREVAATIVQPRNAKGGAVRTTVITPMELLAWSGELIEHARATMQPDAPLQVGEWCQFCPAKAWRDDAGSMHLCPARTENTLAAARLAFADIVDPAATATPPPSILLTPAELSAVLHKLDAIQSWAKDVRALALAELAAGRDVPGWKLVVSEGRDAWISADDAKAALELVGVDPWGTPNVVSPAQARARLGRAEQTAAKARGAKLTKISAEAEARLFLKPLLHRPKSLSVAPATDNRPAVSGGLGLTALPDETEATEN